jgi:hypothetical protein
MKRTKRIYPHTEGRTIFERTDPDYMDHRLARMVKEVLGLQTNEHRLMYLNGLNKTDFDAVLQRLPKSVRKELCS